MLTAKKQKKSPIPNPTQVWSAAKKSPLKHSPELRRRNHGPRSTRGPKRHRSTACSAPHAGNPSHHGTTSGPPGPSPQEHRGRSTKHGATGISHFFFLCLSFYFVLNECCSPSFWLMPLKAFQPFDRIILKSVCDFSTALVLFFFGWITALVLLLTELLRNRVTFGLL